MVGIFGVVKVVCVGMWLNSFVELLLLIFCVLFYNGRLMVMIVVSMVCRVLIV